ncbi:serine hydrolase [Pseudonocardia bannensis]|uniref:Beta-lactamase family protein n=1 Tax=Pseudonocardia bannensis TaxID=630973 RepID=A0A848DM22_9PSEU|nr:serine hydrolase [Pseudonocardia bannensis]NMH93579.1 beta-lactamase family protein [Pseudonocardia bannensis]
MIVTEWQGRHGLSAPDFQHQFDQLVAQGHRLVKVSGFAVNGADRYVGVWQRRGGNEWQARHGISAEDYQAVVATLERQQLRPTHVSAFRLGDRTLFSAIWEQEVGLPWIARHDLSSAAYQALFDELVDSGWRLRCVSGYEVAGEARYAGIWDQYAGPPWQARHGLDAQAHQREFDALSAEGYRPIQVAGYAVGGVPRFASIWEMSPGHPWSARHDLPDGHYQHEFDVAARRGLRLVDVSGYGVAGGSAYTTIWEDASADRPDAGPVSALVIPFMQKWAVPGLSLTVARNGNPVAGHVFGYANPITRETVTFDTRFRVAGLSKPITSAAVFRLIEQGRLALDDRVFGAGSILGTRFGTPCGPDATDITVRHLLEHTAGGWSNDGDDPMFSQPTLSQEDLITWTLANRPATAEPGIVYAYSNFGYCLLGRVIEAVTGRSYADVVRDEVLGPAQATSMTIAGDTAAERHPSEAMYTGLGTEAPYRLRVRRMDAHGGWLGTPGDVIRFALRVDGFPQPPDLLAPATVAAMAAPCTVNPDYARGWALTSAGTREHDGLLPGTYAVLVRTADQHEWAAACNTGSPRIGLGRELRALMWQVDAVV